MQRTRQMRDIDVGNAVVPKWGFWATILSYEAGKLHVRREPHHTAVTDQAAADQFRKDHSNLITLTNEGDQHIGMGPTTPNFVIFDFPPSLLESFSRIVDACHRETSFAAVKQLDDAMLEHDGVSALQGGLLLEMLVYVALKARNASLAEGLIDSPPYQGPSPPLPGMPDGRTEDEAALWRFHEVLEWIRRSSCEHPSWMVTAKLIRTGWIKIDPWNADWVWTMFETPASLGDGKTPGEPEAKAIFDALEASEGFVEVMKSSPGGLPDVALLLWFSRGLRCTAPISLLRHIATVVPFASLKLANRLMHEAALAGPLKHRGEAGLRELLEFLVDEQGLDIDAAAECMHYTFDDDRTRPRHSALHAATQGNNVVALRFLLDRGAKITRDGEGRTPAKRTADLGPRAADAASFWSKYLRQRHLTARYVSIDD